MRQNKPNVVLILNDDMGYSDIGCYGGEVQTPNLDWLAKCGLRFTQFYNTPRCSPSRASLLTGLHPHQTGIGVLTYDMGPEGYAGNLNKRGITIAEALKTSGYRSYMSGKWHIASNLVEPSDAWPRQRGFDRFYGTIIGAGSFYDPNTLTRENTNIENEAKENSEFFYTDAISDQAASHIREHARKYPEEPFFEYVAYTAPHWPLHAHEKDIRKYRGRFDKGWDGLREERYKRMVKMGIIDESWELTERDPTQPPWESAEYKAWEARRMEVYAAQIDRMDQGIGRILDALEDTDQLDNTLIIFLSDNGGCAENIPDNVRVEDLVDNLMIAKSHTRAGEEIIFGNRPEIMPGPENTYQSYGTAWANLSNTPFRRYKHWAHEGGISTPLIMYWPEGIPDRDKFKHAPGQITDIMPTILEVTGTVYPQSFGGNSILPLEGVSLVPLFHYDSRSRRPLFWEHEGNAAMRDGKWKLVREYPKDWELYDMEADRTEMHDLSSRYPDRVKKMSREYERWSDRCGVIPRAKILKIMESQGKAFWEEEN